MATLNIDEGGINLEKPKFLEAENQIEQANSSEMHGKYLTFWTDNQLFGIPISDVVQIVGI